MSRRYSGVAIALHWLIAALVVVQFPLGAAMTRMSPGLRQFELYQLHKSLGLTILALTLVRLAWRLTHRPPPLPERMPRWERSAARAAHAALYAAMLALPLLGWATVSTSPLAIPTLLWDRIPIPHLPLAGGRPYSDSWAASHAAAAWGALLLILLHVAAALRHQLIARDEILYRMLPIGRPPRLERDVE